jgi:VanZ family protein
MRSGYSFFSYGFMQKQGPIMRLIFGDAYRTFRFRFAFILFGLILGLGSIPGARAEVGQVASGLILHSLAYSVITYLLFTGLRGRPGGNALKAWLIIAAMGALDEFVQSFIPYRNGTVRDWAVDVTAGFVVVLLLWIVSSRKPAANTPPSEK